MNSILQITKLNKKFGRIHAVRDLDLTIQAGQVYGLLGPNGSGKTTTLGMILDVVAPTSGRYQWFENQSTTTARKHIGSILETPCFYPYLTAVQNLRITAQIKGADPSNIEKTLELVGLLDRKDDKFKNFSLGMKQRLSIGAALLADPPVLILDEPTNGLDPQGIAEIRLLINDIAAQGKTIILASHLLDEVQRVCSHFCVLRNGVKLHEGPVNDILGETNVVEVASSNMDALNSLLSAYPGISHIERKSDNIELTLSDGHKAELINAYCAQNGLILNRLVTKRKSLEEEFLKILKEHD